MKDKQLSRFQIVLLVFLGLLLVIGIGAIFILNSNTAQNIRFLEEVITSKYEGSLSENRGFLTMLTAELTNLPEVKEEIENKEVYTTIKEFLLTRKKDIERKIKEWESFGSTEDIKNLEPANLELIKDTEEGRKKMVSWMQAEVLSKINYTHLNLEPIKENKKRPSPTSYRPYFHSSRTEEPLQSFVLVPKQVVSIKRNKEAELSYMTKQEIIFSKLIERDLKVILDDQKMKDNNIWQVYFIPLSGMVRILNRETENPLIYYKDKLPGTAIFSDRPYFKQTLASDTGFRESNPYIDSGGNGLVITYSILIRSETLNITGMIGVDRKIGPFGKLRDSFRKLKLGSPLNPKGFRFMTHVIYDQACNYCHQGEHGDRFDYKYMGKIFEKEALPLAVAEIMEESGKFFKNDIIARLDFPGRKSTVYCVKLGVDGKSGKDEVAFFHFDPGYTSEKSSWLLISYVLSLVAIIIPVVLAVGFFISRHRAQRTHIEVVSHLNGGLIIVDVQGNIVFNNRRMLDMLRVKHLGNTNFYTNLLTSNSMDECKQMILKSKAGFEFSGHIKRSDGTEFPAIISNTPINYPGVANARMSIIIPSEQLERAIAAEFIHGFSHALKTPVHSILLLADRLRRKSAQKKFDYYYSLMRREVDEFDNMVTNLLRFSKLEVEEITLNKGPFNLANLVRSAVKPFREKIEKAGIILRENIPESLPVQVDREIIKVILNNLLENALKYTEEGEISVEARMIKEEAVVTVSNTGVEIPEDESEKIFDKFYRGQSQEVQEQDGIGIGLYVSKKYAKLHGGSLIYKPGSGSDTKKKGGGSRFILRIPKE